jgi:prepilin-type N-terminal cleavage/methylation domain-containing protein
MSPRHTSAESFTLIELLVVVTVVGILAGLLAPALSRAQERGRTILCASQERQLNLALVLYRTEHEGRFPPPAQASGRWPKQLLSGYGELQLLCCPTDPSTRRSAPAALTNADIAPRSYLINGFADYYLGPFMAHGVVSLGKQNPFSPAMKESAIACPSETIVFGEKSSASVVYELDVFKAAGGYLDDLAENRHANLSRTPRRGGANYAMADGGQSYLSWGKSTCPVNLWAADDAWRRNSALCRPR